MNILLIVLGIILILWGTSGLVAPSAPPTPSQATPTPPMPPYEEVMRQLTEEAAKRQVFVRIFDTATYEGEPDRWMGMATTGKMFNMYVEEGATDYWRTDYYPSQAEAAWALVQALRMPPTAKPMRKEMRDRKKSEAIAISPEN